jgi:hypothetical protein
VAVSASHSSTPLQTRKRMMSSLPRAAVVTWMAGD